MTHLRLLIFLAVVVAILNQCDANDLMKELDKPHAQIRGTLMTQLKRIAGELSRLYKHRPNHDYTQWVVATPLKIERSTKSGEDPFILTMEPVDIVNHVYSNFKKNNRELKKYCDDGCTKQIDTLTTKIFKTDLKNTRKTNIIHTEMQMLCRNEADNILHNKDNKDKVILVYSKYIPCSQNQNSNGGTFVECAGELANFIANHNPNRNKLIVFYETQHTAVNERDSILVSSVVGVSQLYMEMSGIVAFKYTPGQNGNLVRDSQLVNMADHFRENPMFLHLGRPLMNMDYKATVSQLFIDCLARNDFVMPSDNREESLRARFITVKNFLSRLSHSKKYNLKKLVDVVNGVINPTDKNKNAIVKGCEVFVNEMFKDCYKNPYIITEKEETDYLTFEGFSTKSNTELLFQSQEDICSTYLNKLNEYFKTKIGKQDVCSVDYYLNGDGYDRRYFRNNEEYFDDNMNNGFYGYNGGGRDYRNYHDNSISNDNYNNHMYDTNNNRRNNGYNRKNDQYNNRKNTNYNNRRDNTYRNNGGRNTYNNNNYQSRRGKQRF